MSSKADCNRLTITLAPRRKCLGIRNPLFKLVQVRSCQSPSHASLRAPESIFADIAVCEPQGARASMRI
jgi:hypothetical protein